MDSNKKAWVVSVDMGLGHMRAAYPFLDIAYDDKLIVANNYDGIPKKDRRVWESSRILYEFLSNSFKIPFIGKFLFRFLENLEYISEVYQEGQNAAVPNAYLNRVDKVIRKGWGKHLIEKMENNPLPMITTFFATAFMADYFEYSEKIFCIVTDTDISRIWAPKQSLNNRIIYLTPTEEASRRLISYGVSESKIIKTGFPIPKENLGSEKNEIAIKDLANRIINLDPREIYQKNYSVVIEKYLGKLPKKSNRPLTLMFSIGGAGVQREVVLKILGSLAKKIHNREIKFIISVGTKIKSKKFIENELEKYGPNIKKSEFVEIIFDENKEEYFKKFNKALHTTDILWTKPSELSFYSSLGLPIIIAPPIGVQEKFNEKWLLKNGAGIVQGKPENVDEWLFDYLNTGLLAEIAMQGFIEIEKNGTFTIEKLVTEN